MRQHSTTRFFFIHVRLFRTVNRFHFPLTPFSFRTICMCSQSSKIIKNKTVKHTLSGRIGKVVVSHAAVARSSPAEIALIYTMHVAVRGVLPMRVGGATSQLDLPSLTPLSLAGCG